jgi:hypothetical protein
MEPLILDPSNQFGSTPFAANAILALIASCLCLALVRPVLYKIAPSILFQTHESLQSGKY